MQQRSASEYGIGDRMREVRQRAGYSQAKAAAMIDVSERSYKGYELGKREPSLISVINFCERFEIDCGWLVWGASEPRSGSDTALALQVTESIYSLLHDKGRLINPRKFAHFSRIVLDNCRTNGKPPAEEATRLLPLIEEDETGGQ